MLRLIAVGVVVTCSVLLAAPVPKPTERELKARWGEIRALGTTTGRSAAVTVHGACRDERAIVIGKYPGKNPVFTV